MHVLGINGSGRAGGNTGMLVEGALQGARAAGATTEYFELATWDLRGCTGCQGCKTSHRCVVKDDMQRFYDIAAEVDVLVLGTPIYLDHATAQAIAFIQRLYCYLGPSLENHYPNPAAQAVLGITYGDTTPEGYQEVLDWLAGRLLGYFGIHTVERFTVPGAMTQQNIEANHPEVRRAAEFMREWLPGADRRRKT